MYIYPENFRAKNLQSESCSTTFFHRFRGLHFLPPLLCGIQLYNIFGILLSFSVSITKLVVLFLYCLQAYFLLPFVSWFLDSFLLYFKFRFLFISQLSSLTNFSDPHVSMRDMYSELFSVKLLFKISKSRVVTLATFQTCPESFSKFFVYLKN